MGMKLSDGALILLLGLSSFAANVVAPPRVVRPAVRIELCFRNWRRVDLFIPVFRLTSCPPVQHFQLHGPLAVELVDLRDEREVEAADGQ